MAVCEEVLHYAVVKCACGAEPPDALSDIEACNWLTRHIAGEQHKAKLRRQVAGRERGDDD
jgi:hypothetical protein